MDKVQKPSNSECLHHHQNHLDSTRFQLRFRIFRLAQLISIVVYYFIQIIRYMFRSYDHLQVEIYTSEIDM
jgi:hypothetical protein